MAEAKAKRAKDREARRKSESEEASSETSHMSIKGRGGQQGIGAYRNKRVRARREAREQRS